MVSPNSFPSVKTSPTSETRFLQDPVYERGEDDPDPLRSHFSDLQIFQGQCRHHLGMVEEIFHSRTLVEERGGLRSEGPLLKTPENAETLEVTLPHSKDPAALPITPSLGEGPEKPSG